MNDHLERLKASLANRYTIERELGAGGMATVYEAEDLKHHRTVALKVLKPEPAAVVGTDRFLREIGVAARLNHPHILPLLDSGEAEGTLYFTMPLVVGPSLADRIRSEGQLGIDEIGALVADVASALDYAHAQGIVHRDIKPANVLLHHGKPMIADFGIALAVSQVGGERLTETGLSIGTPQYMSPEQVSGDRTLDARSDVYALGCVVYEMLVGDPPFTGRTALAVMARHVTDPVPPIRSVRRDVPSSVDEAVTKALAKVPGDRFASVGEFASALAASDVAEPTPRADSAVATADERPTIAVLPFANVGQDPENEYFAEGVWEDVLANLSRVDGLRAISRTSCLQFKETTKSMRQVGEALGAGMILEGSVRRVADRVRVVVQLVDAQADEQRWAETYDRELTDLFAIQSEVALSVATALRAALTPGDRKRLEQRPTDDLAAYDLYLLGRHHLNKRTDEAIRQAIGHFESALALDPRFVSAHAGLAEAYLFVGMGYASMPPKEALPRARVAAARAIELDPSSAEAHATHGFVRLVCDWDAAGALAELRQAVELNPDRPEPHQWLAWCLVGHGEIAAGLESWQRALDVDPLSAVVINENGWPYSYVRLDERALEWYRRAIEIDPALALAHYNAGWALHRLGRLDEAIPAYERGVKLSGGAPFMRAFLATAFVDSGRPEDGRRILDDLLARSAHAHGMGLSIAMAAEALGEQELALDWLDRAFEERDPFLFALGLDDAWMDFGSVRDHPRFIALLDRIGIGRSLPSDYIARERAKILARMKSTEEPETLEPAPQSREAPAASKKPMIVVLPLTNMSPSAEDEYFSDGMTEDIIAQLSQIGSLQVISRTSAMRYKNSTQSVKEIAGALGATHVVEGSVRRAGDRLRIVAQLIDASSDAHLWADTFDRDMTDVFAVQSEVAERIAGALERKLTPDELRRFARRPTGDMEAYREYLLGRHHWARWTEDDFKQSIRHFETAIERDPDFAEAHAALSEAWSHLGTGYWSVRPLDAYPKARDAALRAVELDPESAEAHARLAMVEWWFEFAFDRARERLERATALNPNCASAFDYQANLLTMLGRHEEALALAQRSCELDPASVFINANYGLYLYRARKWSEAIMQLQRVIDLDPNLPMGHALQALAYVESGDGQRALKGFRRADELSSGHHAYRVMLGYGHAAAGNRDLARQILSEIEAVRPEQNVWLVMLAAGYAKLGETERALDLLEDAYRERGGWIVWAGVEPGLDTLRDNARFQTLTARLGLLQAGDPVRIGGTASHTSSGQADVETRPRLPETPQERNWVLKQHKRPIVLIAAVAAVAATVILVVFRFASEAGAALDPDRVAVQVLRNATADPSFDELGAAAGHWITQGLQRAGVVQVVPWETSLQSWRFVEEEVSAGRLRDPLQAFAAETGAGTVVSGTYYLDGDSLQFQADVTEATRGTSRIALDPVRGSAAEPMRVVEALRQRVLGSLAVSFDERLVPFVSSGAPPPTLGASRAFQRGIELYLDYAWSDAVDQFLEAARLDSTFLTAVVYAASSADIGGHDSLADSLNAVLHQRRVELSPVEAYVVDAAVAAANGDYAGRIRALERAVAIAPESYWTYRYARELTMANRLSRAIEVLTTQLQPEKGAMRGWAAYWALLTQAYHQLGDHRSELETARRAREVYPDRLQTVSEQLNALGALGRIDEAMALWHRSANMDPDWGGSPGVVLVRTGRTFSAHGYPEAAQRAFETAVDWFVNLPPEDLAVGSTGRWYARALYEAGRLDEAQGHLERMEARSPGDPANRRELGIIAAKRGDREEAMQVSDWLAGLDDLGMRSRSLWRGMIAAQLGDREEAVRLIRVYFDEAGYSYWTMHHSAFNSLRDYPPFQELMRPKE